jgi:hypothetical protein
MRAAVSVTAVLVLELDGALSSMLERSRRVLNQPSSIPPGTEYRPGVRLRADIEAWARRPGRADEIGPSATPRRADSSDG